MAERLCDQVRLEIQSPGVPADFADIGAIPSDTLQLVSDDDTDKEPWLAFLPFVSEDVIRPIFHFFIRRAAIVMSSINFEVPHLPPLPDNMSLVLESAPFKLLTASNALLKLYNSGCDSRKSLLLEVVKADQVFIYNAVKLACKVLQLYGDPVMPFWQGPATGFIGLIVWSLDSSNSFRKRMKELGLLTSIVSHLSLLPLEAIQDMSEKKILTQTVWLLLRILFQCTTQSNTVESNCSCSQALRPFLKVPDVELRLISKALFACWSLMEDCLILGDIEVLRLKQMLNTDLTVPFSFHGLSFEALFTMMQHLAKVPQNAQLFVEKAIPPIIADLSERLLGDEQEAAIKLLWFLMQVDSDTIIRDTTDKRDCTEPGLEAEKGHQQEIDDFCQEVLKPSLQDEAAVEFTEFLIRYLIRTLLPYENLPLEDGFSQLPESTWFSISVSIMLVALLLRESSEQIQTEIIQSVVGLHGACKAIQLAIEIGLTIKNEGLPKSVMLTVMKDLLQISMTWTDQSRELTQEMSRSGFVHMLTMHLHAGSCINMFNQNVMTYVLRSLFTLLNCAYDPSNHPAFRFAETVPELIRFVESTNFDVASTAKFTLSCLHQQLDCDQLLALKLTDGEAEYCVSTLAATINTQSFKADGFAVHELLDILINLTHSYSAMKKFVMGQSVGRKKQKRQEELGSFDQRMLIAADELERNSQKLMSHGLLSVIERVLKVEKFQGAAAKLLWNLLHHEPIKAAVKSDFPAIIEILEFQYKSSVPSDHQLIVHCCLWQLRDTKQDHRSNARYVQGCYKFEGYFEAFLVCSEIVESISDGQDQLMHEMKLLKGKASFHIYQRKIWYLMENRSTIPKVEEKRLIEECFHCMMETINLLGTTLDNLHLDNEGSQLLDWAMMDCIRETNKLNQCKRCLLCRQCSKSLCKSHIFPKFILKNAPLTEADNPPSTPNDESEGHNIDSSNKTVAAIESTAAGIQESSKKVNIKPFLFGLDKHQMKSAGECWLWMCCKKCEEIMTQNAENHFSRLFPTSGEIEYSSWLFSYCCTILFRSLSCVKFPRTLNDEEVYSSFLFCRMHLLSLPIKYGGQDSAITDVEKYQLRQLSQTVFQDMKPFLLITPPNIIFKSENISPEILAIPWLAPHRLVDGRKDLAGSSHFFVAYCNGISILLKFLPSFKYQLPDSCCISPQCGTYTIPKEGEIVDKIPPGLWLLHHRSNLKSLQDVTEALRQMGTRTAEKMASITRFTQIFDNPEQLPSAPTTTELSKLSSGIANSLHIQVANTSIKKGPAMVQTAKDSNLPNAQLYHSNKPQFSLLPPEFKVTQPLPNSQIDKCIKLPKGHQIVLHRVEKAHQLSCLIVVGSSDIFPPDQPYVIFLHNGGDAAYIDGAFITTVDKEIHLTQFLQDHAVYSEMREQLKVIHQGVKGLLTLLLKGSGFMNLEVFIHHLKCRQSIRGSDDLPSLGTKCSPEGCWYCKDLCHCCLKPAFPWSKGENLQDIPYRFCSKKCMGLLCFHPSKMPQSMFVIDHRDEFRSGKFKGPSILDVLYISRREGKQNNTVEFINFCMGDGSKGLPLREPYILWQFRDMDSQFFLNFHTTVECIPLGPLWPSLLTEDDDVIALQEAALKLEPKLAGIIKTAVQALGCEDIQGYISAFHTLKVQ